MDRPGDIDDLFREGLEDVQPEFSSNSWEQMESMLNQRTRVNWYRRAGVAAAGLAVIAGGWFFLNTDSVNEAPAALAEQTSVQSLNNPSSQNMESASLLSSTPDQNNSEQLTALPQADLDTERNTENSDLVSETVSVDQTSDEVNEERSTDRIRLAALNLSDADWSGMSSLAYQPGDAQDASLEDAPLATLSGDPISPKSIRNKRSEFGLRAGLLLNEGWQNKTGVFGGRFLQTIGFSYAYHLSRQWTLETGLNYKALSGKGSTLTFTQVDYGFGKSVTTTEIKARSMHYLEMPLDVRFDINPKHTLYAGASVSYLLNVKSDVSSVYDESLASIQTEDKTYWGYQSGFNSWDVAIRAGYDYQVNERLNVGVLGSYGLTDVTNDQFFTAGSSRNKELRLNLSYRLINF